MTSEDAAFLKDIEDVDDLRASVFVWMCAERVKPVVAVFASAQANAVVDSVLDGVWGCLVAGVNPDASEQQIRALREATVDDSNDPSYYAMRALGLVVDAIHASASTEATLVTSASAGTCDLARDLRFHLRALTTHDNRLDDLEVAAEIEAAQHLKGLRPGDVAGAFKPLRELARQRASAFADGAKALAQAWGSVRSS